MALGKNLIVGLVVILIVIAGALWYFGVIGASTFSGGAEPSLSASAKAEEGIPSELVERNTLMAVSLSEAGLEDALVDITRERVLVRLTLPAGMDEKATAYYIFGLAAGQEPNVSLYVVQFSDGTTLTKQYDVDAADVKAAADGKLTEEAFDAKVRVS